MKSLLFLPLCLLTCLALTAQESPFDPDACTLEQVGQMNSFIGPCKGGGSLYFGSSVKSVGDVNEDGLDDWCVEYLQCDTVVYKNSGYRMSLLRFRIFYDSVVFPTDTESSLVVGPDEVEADAHLLTSGDFDGDAHRDLVIAIFLKSDASGVLTQYTPNRLVVYWGNGSGRFSNADTNQIELENGRSLWGGITSADVYRVEGESCDRLYIQGGFSFDSGQSVPTARLHVYALQPGERWGRGTVSRMSVWSWWYPYQDIGSPHLKDQDGDTLIDLCLIESSNSGQAAIGVVYGTSDGFFDTVNTESISLDSANGYSTVYTDLTGDGLPEIVTLDGDNDLAKVYIGKRGQRLRQQYGTGNDPPHPGESDWWSRPWASLWLPRRFDPGQTAIGYGTLYTLGDIGRDGIGDLVTEAPGSLLVYNGGKMLDSLIDGVILKPGTANGGARLGNIDGSGLDMIAVRSGYNPGSIIFYHPDNCISRTQGSYTRDLPEGTGPSDVPRFALPGPPLEFTATPSPAHDNVVLRWSQRSGSVSIAALDMQGRTLQRWSLLASSGSLLLDLTRWPRGSYLFSLSASMNIVLSVRLV